MENSTDDFDLSDAFDPERKDAAPKAKPQPLHLDADTDEITADKVLTAEERGTRADASDRDVLDAFDLEGSEDPEENCDAEEVCDAADPRSGAGGGGERQPTIAADDSQHEADAEFDDFDGNTEAQPPVGDAVSATGKAHGTSSGAIADPDPNA